MRRRVKAVIARRFRISTCTDLCIYLQPADPPNVVSTQSNFRFHCYRIPIQCRGFSGHYDKFVIAVTAGHAASIPPALFRPAKRAFIR